MPCSLFITTSWNTRGKAAKSLKAFGKYTSHAPITVFQNGGSPVPMDKWLEEETGFSGFTLEQSVKPVKHGHIWNWCMYNSLYEWVIIVDDVYYPTEHWDLHFDMLTRHYDHELMFLGDWAGASSFAITQSLWHKLRFNPDIDLPSVQMYSTFLKVGFMNNLTDALSVYKNKVFNYTGMYMEPLFESEEVHRLYVDEKELSKFWSKRDSVGAVEDPSGTKRSPVIFE